MNGDILVEQTLAGDHQAFNSLITDYYTDIYGMILSWVKNPEDAKDLTQDVFISAYLDLSSLRDRERFYSWLRQIARHKCQNWKRKQIDFVPLHDDLISKEPSTDEVLILRETLAKVMDAIDNLPESEKRLLKEHYLDDVSYDELEARHGVSAKALVVRLVRTRRKIRDQLEKTLSAFVAFLHDHTESILTGGMEIVKLGVKTKLIAGGIAVMLATVGTGVLVKNHYTQNTSEQILNETNSEMSAKPFSVDKKLLVKGKELSDKKFIPQIKSQVEKRKNNIDSTGQEGNLPKDIQTEAVKANNAEIPNSKMPTVSDSAEFSENERLIAELKQRIEFLAQKYKELDAELTALPPPYPPGQEPIIQTPEEMERDRIIATRRRDLAIQTVEIGKEQYELEHQLKKLQEKK